MAPVQTCVRHKHIPGSVLLLLLHIIWHFSISLVTHIFSRKKCPNRIHKQQTTLPALLEGVKLTYCE